MDQYHRLVEIDVLGEESRTELIDGLIYHMAPFTAPHIAAVNRLTRILARLGGDESWVSVQNALRLDDGSEPEPDVVVLRPGTAEDRVPEAADALLVVEVAHTTEAFDRNVKVPRYAAASVPEVWLVLPGARAVDVFRRPGPGGYAEARRLTEDDVLNVLGGTVAVRDVLPPA